MSDPWCSKRGLIFTDISNFDLWQRREDKNGSLKAILWKYIHWKPVKTNSRRYFGLFSRELVWNTLFTFCATIRGAYYWYTNCNIQQTKLTFIDLKIHWKSTLILNNESRRTVSDSELLVKIQVRIKIRLSEWSFSKTP